MDVVNDAYFVWVIVANVRGALDIDYSVYLFCISHNIVQSVVRVVENSLRSVDVVDNMRSAIDVVYGVNMFVTVGDVVYGMLKVVAVR